MEKRSDSGGYIAQLPAGDNQKVYLQKPRQSLRNLGLIFNEA